MKTCIALFLVLLCVLRRDCYGISNPACDNCLDPSCTEKCETVNTYGEMSQNPGCCMQYWSNVNLTCDLNDQQYQQQVADWREHVFQINEYKVIKYETDASFHYEYLAVPPFRRARVRRWIVPNKNGEDAIYGKHCDDSIYEEFGNSYNKTAIQTEMKFCDWNSVNYLFGKNENAPEATRSTTNHRHEWTYPFQRSLHAYVCDKKGQLWDFDNCEGDSTYPSLEACSKSEPIKKILQRCLLNARFSRERFRTSNGYKDWDDVSNFGFGDIFNPDAPPAPEPSSKIHFALSPRPVQMYSSIKVGNNKENQFKNLLSMNIPSLILLAPDVCYESRLNALEIDGEPPFPQYSDADILQNKTGTQKIQSEIDCKDHYPTGCNKEYRFCDGNVLKCFKEIDTGRWFPYDNERWSRKYPDFTGSKRLYLVSMAMSYSCAPVCIEELCQNQWVLRDDAEELECDFEGCTKEVCCVNTNSIADYLVYTVLGFVLFSVLLLNITYFYKRKKPNFAGPTLCKSLTIVLPVLLSVVDVATDLFSSYVIYHNIRHLGTICFIFSCFTIVFTIFCNIAILFKYLDNRRAALHFTRYRTVTTGVILLSALRVENVKLMTENLLGINSLSLQISSHTMSRLELFGLVSLCIEDLPQLMIQVYVLVKLDTTTIIQVFSIVLTLISFLNGFTRRCCGERLRNRFGPGSTYDAVTEESVSTQPSKLSSDRRYSNANGSGITGESFALKTEMIDGDADGMYFEDADDAEGYTSDEETKSMQNKEGLVLHRLNVRKADTHTDDIDIDVHDDQRKRELKILTRNPVIDTSTNK